MSWKNRSRSPKSWRFLLALQRTFMFALVLCFVPSPANLSVPQLLEFGTLEAKPLAPEKKKQRAKKTKNRKNRKTKTHTHRVAKGETLSGIADLYDVTVEDLKKWNKLKSANKIREGKKLRIRATRGIARKARIDYIVQDGDSFWTIAKKFGVSVEHLMTVNRKKDDRIRPGDEIVVYAEKLSDIGIAKGKPNNGHLVNGQRMPPMKGLVIRHPNNSYGAWNTINNLKKCFSRLHRRYPPFMLGDISRKRGGSFKPHLSHQNGLDVDLGFVPRQRKLYGKRFDATKKGTMNAWKTWNLIQCFMRTKEVEYIFIDIPIQKALYHVAKKSHGPKQLRRLFSFMERKGVGPATIRTSPGHDDHMHIRFKNIRPKLSRKHKKSSKKKKR